MYRQLGKRIILAAIVGLMGTEAFAQNDKIDVANSDGVVITYKYINGGKELEVAKVRHKGHVTIPEEVTFMNRSRKVTSIGKSALSGPGVTSVSIPNTVTSIGEMAFSNCWTLKSITFPSSVTTIGKQAFQSCIGLTSITIPSNVESIGEYNQEIKGKTNVEIIPVSA